MLNTEIEISNGKAVIMVSGRIDSETAADFQSKIDSAISTCSNIEINLKNTEYVSSAGLRVFLSTQKKVNSNKGSLVISDTSAQIREVFEMTGFTNFLTII